MFDIKWIRDNSAAFDHAMARRGLAPQAEGLIAIDDRRRALVLWTADRGRTRDRHGASAGGAGARG